MKALNTYLAVLLLALFVSSHLSCKAQSAIAEPKSNVLFIMADDLGYSDLNCFGGEILTPNIDALAKDGERYAQFYTPGKCASSRAAFLTGRTPHEAGVGSNTIRILDHLDRKPGAYQGYLRQDIPTIAEVYKNAGYRTWMTGKWYVGDGPSEVPTARGFDKFFGLLDGANSYYENNPMCTMIANGKPYTPSDKFYATDAYGDSTIAFLREAITSNKPFLGYLAFTAPHWPLHAPEAVIAKYRTIYQQGWDELREQRLGRLKLMGLVSYETKLSNREGYKAWSEIQNLNEEVERMATYAAMVEVMDQAIGRVISYLKKSGQYNNTLIVFLSDNGASQEYITPMQAYKEQLDSAIVRRARPGIKGSYTTYGQGWGSLSNTPFRRGKGTIYEGGVAAPLIVKRPIAQTTKNGIIISAPVFITDLLPMALATTTVAYPKMFKGKVLTKLEGASNPETRKVFYYGWEQDGQKSLRTLDWKLVVNKNREPELYDMRFDRGELNDKSQAYPEKVKELASIWSTWANKVGAKTN